jgi:hypothetical protein
VSLRIVFDRKSPFVWQDLPQIVGEQGQEAARTHLTISSNSCVNS